MSEAIHCPDCGHWNTAGSERCEKCHYPLGEHPSRAPRVEGGAPPGEAASTAAAADPAAEPSAATAPEAPPPAPAAGPESEPVIIRRRRARRTTPGDSQTVLQLWLIFGTIGILAVLFVGIRGFQENASRPVEGSSPAQQGRADALFEALARDSNNVDTHRQLGDVLYDTANWSQAIVHYRAAVRRDSNQVAAIVDLGVCYYNLGRPDEAERHFKIALAKDPTQNVALFNMGIVHEGRDDAEAALEYYHRALEGNPPAQMHEVLHQRITALMQQLGRQPPPLPAGP